MIGLKIIWAGIKGMFTPGSSVFLGVCEVALDMINNAIGQSGLSGKIATAAGAAAKAIEVLKRFADCCPAKWREEFDSLVQAAEKVLATLVDGKLDSAEAEEIFDIFRIGYAKWFAD